MNAPQAASAPLPLRPLKRGLDIVAALVGLIVTFPLLCAIAVAVYVDSGWPLLFRQQRLGRHGRVFAMLKFRKFHPDAAGDGPQLTLAGDPRLTRLGALLERSKLDELPQLWNVLKGEMSLVGPRPESLHFAGLFVGRYSALLDHPPGLFGPSQCHAIDEGERYPAGVDPEQHYREVLFSTKAQIDLAYYPSATLWSDLGWAIRCVAVAVQRTLG